MEESGIVPDVIDVPPNKVVQIAYPIGVLVDQGNELTPTQVKDQSSLQWDTEDNALYTVLMTDPDTPSKNREFLHWLVVNIPGNRISEGKSIADYAGAGPPRDTGLHRYIFLVFKQSNVIDTYRHSSFGSIRGRLATKARDVIKEYNLGVPVAWNFFRAQYDDYVPTLRWRFIKTFLAETFCCCFL